MTKFEDMKVGQKYKDNTDTREILFKTDQTIFVRNLTHQAHTERGWDKDSESFVYWKLVKPTKVLWVVPFCSEWDANERLSSYTSEEEASQMSKTRFRTNSKITFPFVGKPIRIEFEVDDNGS